MFRIAVYGLPPPLPFSWGGRVVRGLLAGLGYTLGPALTVG